MKLKFVKGRGYDTYESKEKKKEHKDESVVFTETGKGVDDDDDEEEEEKEEEEARVTYVNIIMPSFFSNVEVYINHQQIYNSNGLYSHKSYILNSIKAAISEKKKFCIVKAMTMNRILRILLRPYLILFIQRE